MHQITGEYDCRLDAKGRLRLPSALVKQLNPGEGALSFTMNRGFEKHLMLYPSDVWNTKTKEINQLNIYNTRQRQAIRYFYRGATELTLDAADRILVPKGLMDYAGIEQDVVLFAYQHSIEIWSKEQYEKILDEEPEDFASIANEIFGQNSFLGADGNKDE